MKMYPTKNMVDYMSEISRLFSRTDNHGLQSNPYGLPTQSPSSSTNNRSSSSTDSTSPESFPELPTFRPERNASRSVYGTPPLVFDQPPIFETPTMSDAHFLVRRQRPIVGRKVITPETSTPTYERVQGPPTVLQEDHEFLNSILQDEPVLFTPPNVNNIFIEHKNYTTQNVFYELFPTDSKSVEFVTPVKTSPTLSSNVSNLSPTLSNLSPNSSISSMHSMQPNFQRSPPGFGPSSSRHHSTNQDWQKMCTFCRKNGETPLVYMTHSVKERVGNRFIVSCPILRSHVCSTCGASGDNAHTITYCPVLRSSNNGQPLQSTTITLKNTRIKSNGRRRY